MTKIVYIFIILMLSYFQAAIAMEDTQVLPKGVRSFIIQNAQINEIENKYNSSSNLESLNKRYSQSFTAERFQKIAPEAKELVSLLDEHFNKNYSIGSSIYLGELNIDAKPEIEYFAPIFAYGITDKWTLGFGLPFVHLSTKVDVSSSGYNNSKDIESLLYQKSGFSQDLENAFARLKNIDLVKEFHSVMEKRSYKEIQDRDDWYTGDLMIVNKYRYLQSEDWDLLTKLSFNLPTGYKDNADDLMDLPIFGQSSIELAHTQDYKWRSKTTIGSSFAYLWTIADQIDKRVPLNENDILPNLDQKENVDRDLGDSLKWEMNIRHQLHRDWSTGFAYLGQYKFSDYYDGNRDYNYKLLSRNTEQKWHRLEAELRFSTINGFLVKKYLAPMSFAYKYSDVFEGTNVERQQMHNLSLTLLF